MKAARHGTLPGLLALASWSSPNGPRTTDAKPVDVASGTRAAFLSAHPVQSRFVPAAGVLPSILITIKILLFGWGAIRPA